MSSPLTIGSTYRFAPDGAITRDGAPWDLTGATVTVLLKAPSGAITTLTATVDDAAGGLAHADNATGDLSERGTWTRSWKVEQSGVVLISVPVPFEVVEAP